MNTSAHRMLCGMLLGSVMLVVNPAESLSAQQKKSDVKQPASPKEPAKKQAPLPFKTLKENVGYAIGLNFGNNVVRSLDRSLQFVKVDRKQLAKSLTVDKQLISRLEADGIPIDGKRLQEGFADAIADAKPKMTEDQIASVFAEARKIADAHQKKKAAEQRKAGEEFLAKNKKKKGVVTTKSGLQYEILRKGTGKRPGANDFVVAHYVGTLIDGTEFDSSRKRGMPATFQLSRVIQGWSEALQLMRVGGKWRLYIPAKLAYGEQGRPGIPPNSVLIFEVELLGIRELPQSKKSPAPPKEKP